MGVFGVLCTPDLVRRARGILAALGEGGRSLADWAKKDADEPRPP